MLGRFLEKSILHIFSKNSRDDSLAITEFGNVQGAFGRMIELEYRASRWCGGNQRTGKIDLYRGFSSDLQTPFKKTC